MEMEEHCQNLMGNFENLYIPSNAHTYIMNLTVYIIYTKGKEKFTLTIKKSHKQTKGP